MTTDAELCVGAAEHSPRPLWTERHHVYPKYLCELAGMPTIEVLAPLCGSCHENVHHAIHHLLATGTIGHTLAAGSRLLVYVWWDWWRAMLVSD